MSRSHPRSPGLLTLAVFAATLHAATSIVVPLLHARAEVYQSAEEVEASHTTQCPRLHAESTCIVCPAFQLLPDAPGSIVAHLPDDRVPSAAGTPFFRPHDQRPAGHPVRAPPA